MALPVQITFRDIPHSDAIEALVQRRIAKLSTFYDRITRCHVVLEMPHRHQRHGKRFHVRVDVAVPGKELVVTKASDDDREDLYSLVDTALSDTERVVEDHARIRQVDTKAHLKPPHAVVARVFHDRGYGFLEAEDGHEVYFHENSVIDGRFVDLKPGAKVRYAEEDGDKGPQASTVHVVTTH
jgi:ribosomal subunit interface protein